MQFIHIAYCVTVPALALLVWFGRHRAGRIAHNLLAVSNLLLIGHSIFLIRQMIGFYYLAKQFGELPSQPPPPLDFPAVRLLLLIVLPYASLIGAVRRNVVFSIVMIVLMYGHHPFFTWNLFDLSLKIPMYLCLVCTVYALLWLLKKLPYQSV